jgi:hypothetical protein
MTIKEQKDYIKKVIIPTLNIIIPTLIEMKANDELGSDMNPLIYHHFEEAIEKYNNSPEQILQRKINMLCHYVDETHRPVEEQYDAYLKAGGDECIGNVVDMKESYNDYSLMSCDQFHKNFM